MLVVMRMYRYKYDDGTYWVGLRVPKPIEEWKIAEIILDPKYKYLKWEMPSNSHEVKVVHALSFLTRQECEKLYEKALTREEFVLELETMNKHKVIRV